MNRILVMTCAAVAAFAVSAAETNAVPKMSGRLRAAGGPFFVEGSGHIAVINAQKTIPDSSLDESVKQLRMVARDYGIRRFAADYSLQTAKATYEKSGASAAVYVIDDPSLPMSLIALEECWGFVNVAPLKEGADAAKLEKRYQKEFVRVASVVFGGARSQFQFSALQTARNVQELDKIVGTTYGMDTMSAVDGHLKAIGLKPSVQMTYRTACERGIAPPPTNEMQKVVWDRVHESPKRPMRIKFDPNAKK